MDKHHKELKFISSANTQIKFYNEQLPGDIFDRIEEFASVLHIDIEQRNIAPRDRPAKRHEIYFDNGASLAKKQESLSIRTHDGRDIDGPGDDVLLFRKNGRKDGPDGMDFLMRDEFKAALSHRQTERFIRDGITKDDLIALFPTDDLRPKPGRYPLTKRGEINIKRNWLLASVDQEKYYIYVDRFKFIKYDGGKHSEVYTEIDIEKRFDTIAANNNNFHERMVQLARTLKTAFNITVDPTPKYQRFSDFCLSKTIDDFIFIGFDLTDYSARHSHAQKYLSQQFHQIIREELDASGFRPENEPTKISIGDGAIIAMPTDWLSIVGLLGRIKAAVAAHNERAAPSSQRNNDRGNNKQIEYHTGIHFGPVFRFTDLNGMSNLAGQGISTLARVLTEANVGQILVSSDAHKRITDSWSVEPGAFCDVGKRTTKHGQVLHLYEYFLP